MKRVVTFSEFAQMLREKEELEESVSKAIDQIVNGNADYAMISAFIGENTASENLQRNKLLKARLDALKLGAYQVIGFYAQTPDAKAGKEMSFLVVRPEHKSPEAFRSQIMKLGNQFQQDSVLLRISSKAFVIATTPDEQTGQRVGDVKAAPGQTFRSAWGHLRGDVVPVSIEPEAGETGVDGGFTVIYRNVKGDNGGNIRGISRIVGFKSPQKLEEPNPEKEKFNPGRDESARKAILRGKIPTPSPKMESKSKPKKKIS